MITNHPERCVPTLYSGVEFNSREEARWAVFLNFFGIDWCYGAFHAGTDTIPTHSFLIGNEYLFVCHGVPGEHNPTPRDVAAATGMAVYWIGPVPEPTEPIPPQCLDSVWIKHFPPSNGLPEGGADSPYLWCQCPVCGIVGLQFDGRADRLPCPHTSDDGDKGYNVDSPQLLSAYRSARSARFGTKGPGHPK